MLDGHLPVALTHAYQVLTATIANPNANAKITQTAILLTEHVFVPMVTPDDCKQQQRNIVDFLMVNLLQM